MLIASFFILTVVFIYAIIKNHGTYKSVLWYLLGLLLLNAHISPIDFLVHIGAHILLTYSLLGSVLLNFLLRRKKTIKFPFRGSLLIVLFGVFVVGLMDGRLGLASRFSYPIREFFENYICIFLGFYAIRDEEDIKRLRGLLLFGVVVISTYGIFNLMTKSNPYYELVADTYLSKDNSSVIAALDERNNRYRAASTFSRTFDFGYFSALLSFIFLYFLQAIRRSNVLNYTMIGLCIVGMILSNSRTVLLAFSAGFLIYFMTAISIGSKIKYFFLIFVVIVISNLTIPAVSESFKNTFAAVTGEETEVQGSSVDMRREQLLGTIRYWSDSPIIGNGYGFILNELGWADKKNLDEQMRGFESIVFQLLIEQGLVGLITKFYLFISILIYFSRNLSRYRLLAGTGLSILILFLIFALGTGPLGSIPITMTILGIIIKTIELKKYQLRKSLTSIQP